jgi:hypothetical protein
MKFSPSNVKDFINAKRVVMLGKTFMTNLGSELCDMIRDETVIKGQDVRGHKFVPLSEKYAERKAAGKFRRQSEKSARANLALTFDMMQDLQVRRATAKTVTFGWTAVESAKLEGNAKNGRVVSADDKPVSNNVLALGMNRINRKVRLNIDKYASGNKLTIQMG